MSSTVETLKAVITADNKQALAALKETAQAGDNLGKSLANSAKNASGFAISLQDLGVRLSLLKERFIQATDPAKIAKLGGEINQVTRQIDTQTAAYNKLGGIGKESLSGLTKGFSAIRQAAYILPGIGIAGIFNLGFEAIAKAANELGLFTSKTKEAEEAQKKFNDEVKSSREDAEKNVSSLRALIAAAQDQSLSLEQRKHAIRELQDQYPAYFKNLTTEQLLTGDLTRVTDTLTTAIYKRAEARAREADIAAKATTVFENQGKIDKLNEEIRKAADARAAAAKNRGITIGAGGNLSGTASATTSGADTFLKAQTEENRLLKEREALLTKNSALQLDIATSQNKVNQITAETINLDKKEIDVKKEKISELQKILDALNKELRGIQALEDIGAKSFEDSKADKVKAYNKAIEDLAKIGLTLASAKFQELIDKRDAFFKSSGSAAATGKADFVLTPRKQISAPQTPEFFQDFSNSNAVITKAGKDAAQIQKNKDELKDYNQALKDTQAVMNILGPEVDNLYSALARGEDIGQTIGKVFEDLAAQIAKAAIKAALFQAILSAFSGGTSDIIGQAAGSGQGGGFFGIFKKLLGFDGGGTASGPSTGYPVMLHGTEHIMKPGQLQSIVAGAAQMGSMQGNGGANANLQLMTRVSGQDLLLWLQKAQFSGGLTR